MAMPAVDLTGQVFGYLTVLSRHGSTSGTNTRATWMCRCICGSRVVKIGVNLRLSSRGSKKSCGCRISELYLESRGTHGMTGHPAWVTWTNMRSRCENPKDKDYRNYGARGIVVCERWRAFNLFWADMSPTYRAGLTIERMDNSQGYEPENCRWRSWTRQANNRRNNVMMDTPIGRITVAQAARRYGFKSITLRKRIEKGWPPERLLEPVRVWPSMT